jgi:hypothetical protein
MLKQLYCSDDSRMTKWYGEEEQTPLRHDDDSPPCAGSNNFHGLKTEAEAK